MLKNIQWLGLVMLWCANIVNAQVVFSHRTHPYYTHQPVLYEMTSRTDGPIIEFGCGYGSTDMLHEMCKENKRLLISLDDDLDWLCVFSEKYREDSDWHKFVFVPGKPLNDLDNPIHWIHFLNHFTPLKQGFDVCFIDQHPWLARFETIKYMKDKAKYIILHDCDYFPREGIFGKTIKPIGDHCIPGVFDFGDIFRYFKVYFPLSPWPAWTGPPTLLGSEFEHDLPDIDFNAY
jgi:hypothetical protein